MTNILLKYLHYIDKKNSQIVMSVFLYVYETWTTDFQGTAMTMDKKSLHHKILPISYKPYINNKEVCNIFQQVIRRFENILTK